MLDEIIDAIGVEPYFRDDAVVIYHADCRTILPYLEMAQAVVTDIPFNVALGYESYDDAVSDDEYAALCRSWFAAMAPQADVFIVKCPTKTMPIVLPAFARLLGYVWTVVQHSPNATTHGPFNLSLFTQYLIGGKPYKRPVGDFFLNTDNNLTGCGHPAEMPVRPIRKLIEWFTNPSDLILDPFMGSGTTLRAAKDLGRYAIGIEIEEKYCAIAAQRMSQGVLL